MKSFITSIATFKEKIKSTYIHINKGKKISNLFSHLIKVSNKLNLKREIFYVIGLIFIFLKTLNLENGVKETDSALVLLKTFFLIMFIMYVEFKTITKTAILLISLLIKCIQFINSIIQFIIKICKIISKYIIFSYKKTYITQI